MVVIVGPTATGKSAVALAVAEALGGEVVNADAFQLYRGMDIGTAKVPPEQRRGIPHHLLDVLDITEELSVAQFQRRGREVLADLALRSVPAVVVGGSWLYVRALVDDLRLPGSDPHIRARWEQELDSLGPQRLHAVLAERDPEAASHILPTNGRRIVRALEVGELTGQPFAAELPRSGPPLIEHLSFGVDLEPEVLDARIDDRVAAMFEAGLVQEVTALLERGLRDAPTASRALGYPQVIALIDGVLTPGEARAAIVTATRRLARRQRRWFRRDPRTTWLQAGPDPASTASQIVTRMAEAARTLGT